jgi:DNA-directed RNA polymerase specialized sigma24 family protein
MGDTSVEGKKKELIRVTEDPAFRNKVYQYAYKLTRNTMDAENYVQEALTRFVSEVKNKISLKELNRMQPLQYISKILDNIHADRRS